MPEQFFEAMEMVLLGYDLKELELATPLFFSVFLLLLEQYGVRCFALRGIAGMGEGAEDHTHTLANAVILRPSAFCS